MPLTLEITDIADEQVRTQILAPLKQYNDSKAGPSNHRPLVVTLKDDAGEIVGGLWGATGYGWLFVQLLLVPESARGQGMGTQLMAAAEAIARGCHDAWLNTHEFQARGFYERIGYSVFATPARLPARFLLHLSAKAVGAVLHDHEQIVRI